MNLPEPITSKSNYAMALEIVLNREYCWKTEVAGSSILHYAADGIAVSKAIGLISPTLPLDNYCEAIAQMLNAQTNLSGGIFISDDVTIAWVDHIRSFPVFYSVNENKTVISNDARIVLESLSNKSIEEKSVLEFSMAGFVTGSNTLYKNVKCLQPGEVLIYRATDAKVSVKRYYQYIPSPDNTKSRRQNIIKLSAIIDDIILRIIERANGRPIWVPLSAGLDSRLILCKLHEHGYRNLHAFTYGPMLNFEAMHAKKVARALNVPWHFIGIGMKKCSQIFQELQRKNYSRFSDGLKAAASLREYAALKVIKDKKLIPSDAILINGQSGDYITGGHVSAFWYKNETASEEDLFRVLIEKHYGLWLNLKTLENIQIIKDKIRSVLPPISARTPLEFAALEEIWEFDARQVTLVINGQRSYDFFGFDWELPLWERDLCDFYQAVSYDQKQGQSLFKEYLKEYNYMGLFGSREPKIWRWPLAMMWVVPCARIVGLFSKESKKSFYAFMRYYGHYSNQYAFFPFSLHRKTMNVARNIFSLYVRHWFIENKLPLPPSIKNAMYISHDT